jgi:hypothetical protein
VRLDITGGHALGVQRDHVPREAVQAALAFAHRGRLEAAVAVPRHPQVDLADLGLDRLGVMPVAAVARPSTRRIVAFVAEMIGHLDLQAGLQNLAHERGEQTIVAG